MPSSLLGEFILGQSELGFSSPEVSGLTQQIPVYLYTEYNDDEDLQALVESYNQISQVYLDWFNSINLPIYTSPSITGVLLDWVAQGLYGLERPVLPSGFAQSFGPFNTYTFNSITFNEQLIIGATNYYTTSDDIFKRIITWRFYKGDGTQFNVTWLKRRIMRFLYGDNGADTSVGQTYIVSVTFSSGYQVIIDILESSPAASYLQSAIAAGVLPLPFQYSYTVNI